MQEDGGHVPARSRSRAAVIPDLHTVCSAWHLHRTARPGPGTFAAVAPSPSPPTPRTRTLYPDGTDAGALHLPGTSECPALQHPSLHELPLPGRGRSTRTEPIRVHLHLPGTSECPALPVICPSITPSLYDAIIAAEAGPGSFCTEQHYRPVGSTLQEQVPPAFGARTEQTRFFLMPRTTPSA